MSDSPEVAPEGRARDPGFRAKWRETLRSGADVDADLMAGTFAFGDVLDDGRQVAVVDRFAQRTLCYQTNGARLELSPRADAFGNNALDCQALFDYLFFHMIPSPRTVFRGVQRLPAGHAAIWDGQRLELRCYAKPRFKPLSSPEFGALKVEFRRLMDEAVRAEIEPGIPACFLSGGTDSSTVAGYLKQVAGDAHTYSIGFDAAGYDEMEFARIAARHFGATHHEYYVTPDDLVQGIAHVAGAYDQPFGNSSALPAYFCALRAREDGVTKLLAGDGGDELFGGNARYATQKVYEVWGQVPAVLRNGFVKPLLALPGAESSPLLRRGRNYVRDAELGLPDRLHHYNLLLRLGTEQVLERDFLAQVRPESVFEQQREVWALADADNDLDRQLAYDWRYTLAESDLPKVRETTALAGVDVGYPMLHGPLVDFSTKLPTDYKLRGRNLRWFFKQALSDFLPPEIITKQKKGFGLPFGVWANTHTGLRALATESVRAFGQRGVVRPAFVRALLEDHLPAHPGYYGEMVWILMMLEQWLRAHAPDWRFELA
ncbi:MAG: asparagine synthase [Rubrivivax sp.]|nr:asparagine synthase [Rubrivivax sp.]